MDYWKIVINTNNRRINTKIMREIQLTPTEFYKFRKIAFAFGIAFICSIANSMYTVEAKTDALEQIGY